MKTRKGPSSLLEKSIPEPTSSATSAVAVFVKRNGTLIPVGPRKNVVADVKAISGIREAHTITFSGAKYFNILRKNGEVINVANDELIDKRLPTLSRLFNNGIGQGVSGEITVWGGASSDVVEAVGKNPLQVFSFGRDFLAVGSGNQFHYSRKSDQTGWENVSKVETALKGCQGFAVIGSKDQMWLLALLPSESVPRSGVWNAEELGNARKF